MKLNEALNRGFNLLGTSFIALTGVAFLPEIFLEDDKIDKLDDIGLVILAVIAIVWYLTKNHKLTRSVAPVILICLGLLDKIAALIIEHSDKDAVGDDIGGLILFIFATGLIVYQYFKTKKLMEALS